MNERLNLTTDSTAEIEPIEELSRVVLLAGADADGGYVPAGAIGTVVTVLASGEANFVEFETPFHTLINVECDALRLIAGESRANIAGFLASSSSMLMCQMR